MKTERELIGRIAVDSGQVLIVDPCYLSGWIHGEMGSVEESRMAGVREGQELAENHYDECCCATLGKEGAGLVMESLAVASITLYGDGSYPVYAHRDETGRITSLVVDFDDSGYEECEGGEGEEEGDGEMG